MKETEQTVKDARPRTEQRTRVLLADDHARVRSAIRMLLERNPDIVVVGEASNGQQALEMVKNLQPDVLLLDMEMPILNGTQVAARLRESHSPVKILALSAYDDQQYILGMLNGGAAGYLTKDEAPENVVAAVRGVAAGKVGWVSNRVAEKMSGWSQRGVDRVTLTQRELDILQLLGMRLSITEISERLHLEARSIEQHLDFLCSKLKAQSHLDLVLRARQENLIR